MNKREKMLAGSVGSIFLIFGLTYFVQNIFLRPLKELDKQTLALKDKLRQLQDERRAYFSAEDYLKGLAPRTFGRDADSSTAQAGKMLTQQINGVGLQETQFNRQPIPPRRLRGVQEIGWSVDGEGPLEKMLDLLFVLEQAPQIHKIENLVISADRPGRVRARFRYLTLLIENAPEGGKTNLPPALGLDSPQRRFYDSIVQRDLLRPYIPKPADPQAVAQTSAVSGPEVLKVVSLSEWKGIAEAHIADLSRSTFSVYKVGDAVMEGQLAMIDYRTMPMPNKPGLLSYARMILKIGNDYWAVDQGQTLATKYQLTPEQLPAELRAAK